MGSLVMCLGSRAADWLLEASQVAGMCSVQPWRDSSCKTKFKSSQDCLRQLKLLGC